MKIHVPILLAALILCVTLLSTASRPTLALEMPDPDPVFPPKTEIWVWPQDTADPILRLEAKLIGVWPPTVFLQEGQVQIGEIWNGWRLVACDRDSATFQHVGSGARSTVEFPRGPSRD